MRWQNKSFETPRPTATPDKRNYNTTWT